MENRLLQLITLGLVWGSSVTCQTVKPSLKKLPCKSQMECSAMCLETDLCKGLSFDEDLEECKLLIADDQRSTIITMGEMENYYNPFKHVAGKISN